MSKATLLSCSRLKICWSSSRAHKQPCPASLNRALVGFGGLERSGSLIYPLTPFLCVTEGEIGPILETFLRALWIFLW